MEFKKANTSQRLGLPPQLINTLFLVSLLFIFAPYVGGTDFGIFKVPILPPGFGSVLKWLGPLLLIMIGILFIPLWEKEEMERREVVKEEAGDAVHKTSKYRLQSTPDIILNELHKHNINTDGIQILSGFNIHDLKKRVKFLNSKISYENLCSLVESARETAFTVKYAAPKEDEKLENIANFKVDGILEWQNYLKEFLIKLGVSDFKNIEILDVGIGNAYASNEFHCNCNNLTGIDISKNALIYAKDKLPNANLLVGSAEELNKIPSHSIDLYISLRTYQSTLFDIKESLHEAYRVLAKGGVAVISIPIMYLKKDEKGKIQKTLKGLMPQGSSKPSFEYAMQVSEKISNYMNVLGFNGVVIDTSSPFEIYIGARK